MTHAVMASVGGEVERPMKLVGLHADQRQHRGHIRIMAQPTKVVEVLPARIHRVNGDRQIADTRGRQSGDVI